MIGSLILVYFAQGSDPLSGGGGWVGAGLLGLVLAWLLLKHLPDKDNQIDRLIKDKDAKIEQARKDYLDSINGQAQATDVRYREVLALLTKNHESTREAIHAVRNLANSIFMRQRLADAFQSTEVAAWTKHLDGTITSWNLSAEHLLGWKQGEIVGKSIYDRLVPPDRKPEEESILRRISLGEVIDPYMTERLHKDGSRITVFIVTSPIRDQAGRVIGASTIVQNN